MKRILLITTGGTVACSDKSEGRTPEIGAQALLDSIGLPENIAVGISSPFCLDSTDMSPAEWTQLAVIIRENYAEYDGFVITHGTDTLGYAAAALSCLIRNSTKPIVLTGSMLPMNTEGSDAPDNLKRAFSYVCESGARGVSVAFDGKIIDGRCAVKVETEDKSAFEGVNEVDVPSGETRFFDRMDTGVAVVRLTPGAEPPTVSETTKAVVILGFGKGGLPAYGGWERWLDGLTARGVYVVMSTQVLRGGSDLRVYEVGNRIADRVIDAGKMTAEYAAMRAMFALAYSDDSESFRRIFSDIS